MFQHQQKIIHFMAKLSWENFLRQNCANFAEKYIDYNIYDCSVSVDGTWQKKRYGFFCPDLVLYI